MFTKDTRAESFLTQIGANWKYTNDVFLGELVPGWNKTNAARPVPVREEAVLQYAALTESGSPAPAPILYKRDSKFEVLDGVQRISAAEICGVTKLSAYLVQTDSEDLLSVVRVLANTRLQGRAEKPEWNRRRAVEILMLERQMSAKEVALMGGWRATDLEKIAEAIRWQGVVTQIGGPKLTNDMITTLQGVTSESQLLQCPDPVAGFLNAIVDAGFSSDAASPHIEGFFQPSPPAKTAFRTFQTRLEQFKEDPEYVVRITGRRGVALRRDVVLRRQMKATLTVIEEIKADGATLYNVDEFFQLLKAIEKQLKAVAGKRPQAIQTATPADKWTVCQ